MNRTWLKITSAKDGKTSTIDIEGTIGGEGFWSDVPTDKEATKENVKKALKDIAAVKGDTIIININSYGGDVNHGLSIHDLLAQNPANKIVNINGMTASAATVIAMAGNTIKMSDNALFLVHRASSIAWGNANEVGVLVEDLKKIDSLMANIYAKRTGKSTDEVLAQMDKNVTGEWMTASEAKDFGFVDEVFEPTKMAASFDKKFIAKAGLPEIPTNKLKTIEEMDKKTFAANLINGFKSLFNAEENKGLSVEEIEAKIKATVDSVAETEVSKFVAEIKKVSDEATAKADALKAENEKSINAKDEEIKSLKAEINAKQSEIDTLKAGETTVAGKKDPEIEGNKKKKLTANERRAEINAAILRGEKVEIGEDEWEVAE